MASRMGFDLFTAIGWRHLLYCIRKPGWKVGWYWVGDTFNQLWCWVVGHQVHDGDYYGESQSCRRCHHYLPKKGVKE